MDFIIVFVLGYCFRDFVFYIKQLANNNNIDKEFKTIVQLDNEWNNDDLP